MRAIDQDKLEQLGDLLRERRTALGLSAREVARRSDMHVDAYLRLERGQVARPAPVGLEAVANGLNLPVSDFLAAIDLLPTASLPSFKPYLRAKYGDLPEQAVADMDAYFRQLNRKYHVSSGPNDGEDER